MKVAAMMVGARESKSHMAATATLPGLVKLGKVKEGYRRNRVHLGVRPGEDGRIYIVKGVEGI